MGGERVPEATPHASPGDGGAGVDEAVPEAGVGKRGRGQALVVRVEGAVTEHSPKKQKYRRQAELMQEEVGASRPFNDFCFNCKGQGHWRSACPYISTDRSSPMKPAVTMLVEARATCADRGGFVAQFHSVCGGCGHAIVQGRDIIVPVKDAWQHRRCVANQLAITLAHHEEERAHALTDEVETVLEWVRAVEPAHARVQAGPGTGKTQLIVRIYQLVERASPPFVLAFNKDAVTVLRERGVQNACTFHSYGFRVWMNEHKEAKMSAAKVLDIMRDLYPPEPHQPRKHKYRHDVMGLIRHVKKLVSLAKAYALDPDPTRNPDFGEQLTKVASSHISASLRATLQQEQSVAERLQKVCSLTR